MGREETPMVRSQADVLEELMRGMGDEDHLADRVISLRLERGWSQERLAAEMANAGSPIPQSAISKIEKPAAGGRRAITVGEALGFARVFGIPLGQLLLPQHALDSVDLLQNLAAGPRHLQSSEAMNLVYRELVAETAELMARSNDAANIVATHADKVTDRFHSRAKTEFTAYEWQFLNDVRASYESLQGGSAS